MSNTISKNPVALSQDWGVAFHDYAIGGKSVDFQDLMVAVSVKRADAVEKEVSPLSTRIRNRNATLESLGNALSDLTKVQTNFASDASGSTRSSLSISDATYNTLVSVFGRYSTSNPNGVDFTDKKMLKYEVEKWIQMVKSKVDGLNNESQTDMTRLQSLVDRRDESFSTATNLMSTVSDTRSNLIRNL